MIHKKDINNDSLLTKDEYINYIALKMSLDYYEDKPNTDIRKLFHRAENFRDFIMNGYIDVADLNLSY